MSIKLGKCPNTFSFVATSNIFNEYFDNQLLLCIISTDYGYSRILVTDEGFTFVQRPAADSLDRTHAETSAVCLQSS